MKNVLKNIDVLGKVSQLKYRVKDYGLLANTLEEFVLRQERFIERVSWKSNLPPELIRTFATLLGFDIASLKGAAIGAAIGAVIVIGNAAFRILFIRTHQGIDLEIARA